MQTWSQVHCTSWSNSWQVFLRGKRWKVPCWSHRHGPQGCRILILKEKQEMRAVAMIIWGSNGWQTTWGMMYSIVEHLRQVLPHVANSCKRTCRIDMFPLCWRPQPSKFHHCHSLKLRRWHLQQLGGKVGLCYMVGIVPKLAKRSTAAGGQQERWNPGVLRCLKADLPSVSFWLKRLKS